ncbi:MAG TPA: type IV pilus biogenesis/stability protein PilW [Gammaproteobacteria bacterium]|nr:type IV pilus biogenesis/stability protein PilW [Gammaproteobacteria bacterium]
MRFCYQTGVFILVALLAGCGSAPKDEFRTNSSVSATTAAEANANLGLGYMRQGNYSEALTKLERALQQNPKLARAHHYIAELYNRLNERELADKHYAAALKLDPRDASAHNNYGAFLCAQGRYEEAEPHFLAAVRNPLYNGRAASYENAALCASRAGDDVKAEKYFHAALELNSRLPRALYRLAEINYRKQHYLPARAYLQRYEAIAAPVAESLWLGFRIEKQAGNEQAAEEYARQLEQSHPGYAPWRQYQLDGKI